VLSRELEARLRILIADTIPLPGSGQTPARHRRLMEIGRENLSLARLAEAHWDAVAILAEAERNAEADAIYGVWASEKAGQGLSIEPEGDREGREFVINGTKMFCSGTRIVDRVLATVTHPESRLIDIDLRTNCGSVRFDDSDWKTEAFSETRTASATFNNARISIDDFIGTPGWYLQRPGFWHGACGPAACWAGGAAGLVDYAMTQSRHDPHTLAHLGAMHASVWALTSSLDSAGRGIDAMSNDYETARIRALTLRHVVEQACTDILRRLPRAYGPHPLAMNEEIGRRYQELDLYLRQSHAERDLEALGTAIREIHG